MPGVHRQYPLPPKVWGSSIFWMHSGEKNLSVKNHSEHCGAVSAASLWNIDHKEKMIPSRNWSPLNQGDFCFVSIHSSEDNITESYTTTVVYATLKAPGTVRVTFNLVLKYYFKVQANFNSHSKVSLVISTTTCHLLCLVFSTDKTDMHWCRHYLPSLRKTSSSVGMETP